MIRIRQNKYLIPIVAVTCLLLASGVGLLFLLFGNNYAAKVNGKIIDYQTLDMYTARTIKFNNSTGDTVDVDIVRQDTLNLLIDKQLTEDYATDNSLVVSQSALDEYYQQRVEKTGDETKLIAQLAQLYGIDKAQYIEVLRYDLLKNAVQQNTDKPLADWLEEERSRATIVIKI